MKGERFLRHWDQNAERFDSLIAPMERRYLSEDREWVGARVQGRVLEVAIGTGLNLGHYPLAAQLTGVEWSRAMLQVSRRRAHALGRSVSLAQADAASLPFDDAAFDTVVITFSLCCIPDLDGALSEAARVLRPGGPLLLADHVASSVAPIRWGQRLLDLFTVPTVGEHWTRRPLPLLASHGFEVMESERRLLGMLERVHAVRR